MRTISTLLLASSTLMAAANIAADEQVQSMQGDTATAVRSAVESARDTTSTAEDILQKSETQPMTVTEQAEIAAELHESTAEVNRVLEAATEDVWVSFPEYAELQTLLKDASVTDAKNMQAHLDTVLQSKLIDGLTVEETLEIKTEILTVLHALQAEQMKRQKIAVESIVQAPVLQRSVLRGRPWYLRDTNPLWIIAGIITIGQIIHGIILRRRPNFPDSV